MTQILTPILTIQLVLKHITFNRFVSINPSSGYFPYRLELPE